MFKKRKYLFSGKTKEYRKFTEIRTLFLWMQFKR